MFDAAEHQPCANVPLVTGAYGPGAVADVAAPWSWFQNYVLYLGFLDGYRGWLISRMAARGTWLKFKKLGKLVETERRARGARTP